MTSEIIVTRLITYSRNRWFHRFEGVPLKHHAQNDMLILFAFLSENFIKVARCNYNTEPHYCCHWLVSPLRKILKKILLLIWVEESAIISAKNYGRFSSVFVNYAPEINEKKTGHKLINEIAIWIYSLVRCTWLVRLSKLITGKIMRSKNLKQNYEIISLCVNLLLLSTLLKFTTRKTLQ